LRPGVTVPVERLIDELWGDQVPRQPSNALQIIVSKLRKVVGGERIVTRGPGYALMIEPDDVDSLRFERLARDGRAALAGGNVEGAITTFDAALRLFRGDPVADVADAAVAVAAASRWEELRPIRKNDLTPCSHVGDIAVIASSTQPSRSIERLERSRCWRCIEAATGRGAAGVR
jgi:hypothetical protein